MGVHTTERLVKKESQEILDAIRRLVQDLRLADRESENRLGVSGAQLFVLEKLDQDPQLSVNELAEHTRTHQSSVSVVVQRLVEKGLVQRTEAADDRRRVELSLTAAGQKLLHGSRYSPQQRMIDAIDSMPGKNQKELARLLATVVEAMGIGEKPAEMFFEVAAGSPAAGRKTR